MCDPSRNGWEVPDYAGAIARVTRTAWTPEQVDQARHQARAAYRWGQGCRGWHLVDSPDLSVILEQMPARAAELGHAHQRARQCFVIITGLALMELERGRDVSLSAGHELEVAPGTWHRLTNPGDTPLTFIVVSSPIVTATGSLARDRLEIADPPGSARRL